MEAVNSVQNQFTRKTTDSGPLIGGAQTTHMYRSTYLFSQMPQYAQQQPRLGPNSNTILIPNPTKQLSNYFSAAATAGSGSGWTEVELSRFNALPNYEWSPYRAEPGAFRGRIELPHMPCREWTMKNSVRQNICLKQAFGLSLTSFRMQCPPFSQ